VRAARPRRARFDARQGGRGAGRSRSHFPRSGLRVARRGLLDVPRHESRCAPARRALRVDVEPELRGSSGARWTHAPRLARDRGANILIAGANFGCGSSREHAVWALQEFGFRAVIAPTMADIFRSNSIKNGLVPVELNADAVSRLLAAVQADANTTITVDVAA